MYLSYICYCQEKYPSECFGCLTDRFQRSDSETSDSPAEEIQENKALAHNQSAGEEKTSHLQTELSYKGVFVEDSPQVNQRLANNCRIYLRKPIVVAH